MVLLFLEARRISGEVRLSRKHDEYAWVLRRELAGTELPDQLRPFVSSYAQAADR